MKSVTICIGREYGSGGREIGEKLAARLGIPCYDKLLVAKAEQESGISLHVLEHGEEKPLQPALITGHFYAGGTALQSVFYGVEHQVYEAECRIIRQIGQEGPSVIIGRCASAILRESHPLSVFIYADDCDRIARVAGRNELTEKQAERRIRKTDKLRRRFFEFYAGTRWGHPESYDLMLSSSRLGVDGCVELIARAYEDRICGEEPTA